MSYQYEASNTDIQWIKKQALWRNADAKWEAADTLAPDDYLGGLLFEPIGIANQVGVADSYILKRRTNQYAIGTWLENSELQTGRNLYPFFGPITTLDNNPSAGLYTHNGVKRSSQTPINMGRHIQRLNEDSGENEIIDLMGMLPVGFHAECTEVSSIAKQSTLWRVAFTKSTGVDLITRKELTQAPFQWPDFSFPTLTYNSETIEADVRGWAIDILNDVEWRGLDNTKHYSIGKVNQYTDIAITLNLVPTGKNLYELIRTVLESYATDVDITVKMGRPFDSVIDFLKFTHDKLYCYPFDIRPASKDDWYEGYMVRFHQLHTGSLTTQEINDLDDDHYET